MEGRGKECKLGRERKVAKSFSQLEILLSYSHKETCYYPHLISSHLIAFQSLFNSALMSLSCSDTSATSPHPIINSQFIPHLLIPLAATHRNQSVLGFVHVSSVCPPGHIRKRVLLLPFGIPRSGAAAATEGEGHVFAAGLILKTEAATEQRRGARVSSVGERTAVLFQGTPDVV